MITRSFAPSTASDFMRKPPGQLSVSRRNRTLWVCVLVALFGGSALGHDLQTSWTVVRFRPDACELKVKMHGETVRSLIQDEAPDATLEPENIENVRPLLNSFASGLYEVSAGDRQLAALQKDVTLVEDNLEFRLVYPRTDGGPLRLKALYLQRVAPDFIAHLSIEDADGRALSNKILSAQAPSAEVALPLGAAQLADPIELAFFRFLKLGVGHILTGYDHQRLLVAD